MNCPKCNEECDRGYVDVEVGVIHGPYGCPNCGWSEDSQYDHSAGPAPTQAEWPNHYIDQWGVAHSKQRMKDTMKCFKLNPDVIDEVFNDSRNTPPEGQTPPPLV